MALVGIQRSPVQPCIHLRQQNTDSRRVHAQQDTKKWSASVTALCRHSTALLAAYQGMCRGSHDVAFDVGCYKHDLNPFHALARQQSQRKPGMAALCLWKWQHLVVLLCMSPPTARLVYCNWQLGALVSKNPTSDLKNKTDDNVHVPCKLTWQLSRSECRCGKDVSIRCSYHRATQRQLPQTGLVSHSDSSNVN